jgi:DNA-binding LacI/PurR family transcriptional regulator
VTAVLCGNDEVAFGVIKALQGQGRRVPQDVSVAGFDDHPLAELWTPALTTMSQDFTAASAENSSGPVAWPFVSRHDRVVRIL